MLNELSKEIYQNNVEKGFYDDYYDIKAALQAELWDKFEHFATGQRLALIGSEVSEALEGDRKNKSVSEFSHFDDAWKNTLFEIENNQELFSASFESVVKDTVEDEIADAIIRLLDFCGHKEIDIDFHLRAKMKYNSYRPYKHGKKY